MKLLVVGGNGFLGSAITKQALQRNWEVVSLSPSGRPFVTPAGHRPSWSSSPSVRWEKGDAMRPETYEHLAKECDAAVHSVGILLESDYKDKASGPGIGSTLKGVLQGWGEQVGIGGRNPLHKGGESRQSYEVMNRESALSAARVFSSTRSAVGAKRSPFVYISAEDIFRPIVPSRYITTKRQAEYGIGRIAKGLEPAPFQGEVVPLTSAFEQGEEGAARLRPVFLRPGLMYHPHTRPLSTLPAALLDASAAFHAWKVTSIIRALPTPAAWLRLFPGADLTALARLLELSPLHIDTVAKAACEAVVREDVEGAVETEGIKSLAGFGRDREARRRMMSRREEEEVLQNGSPSSPRWPSQSSQSSQVP